MTSWWAQYAWLEGDRAEVGVLIETDGNRIVGVKRGVLDAPAGATQLPGVTIPGLVNSHSHAFHRALRGATQAESGSFWTWRERMYAVAARLQPDSYYRLARATFTEMLLAGITTVGEFHYLHHDTDGVPYAKPTAMAEAIASAASDAGIRLTILDTCYLVGGFGADSSEPHTPPSIVQQRFSDQTAAGWAKRATRTRERLTGARTRVGAAVHSVRAVPADQLSAVAEWAHRNDAPIHAHVSEQPAEVEDCLRVYGKTPTQHLAQFGVLDRTATAVHATHLTPDDVDALGRVNAFACFCTTTEADLADGIGPAVDLVNQSVRLTVGTDSQAVIDILGEARWLELGQRLATNRRGHFSAAQLLETATTNGAASLGWKDLGSLSVGSLADFVTIALDSVRTAGFAADSILETVVFAAAPTDVTHVVVDGRLIVEDRVHPAFPDVSTELRESISAVTTDAP
ncbi:Formiminoglutamic iminohydrolase [Leifsonia rubra CMS 76R]|nr:Formiminoglutamic iminohydrolase [Leifsonia rubra CMS 76R]